MNIDLKTVLPYLVLLITLGMSWGMMSERLNAVEGKADSVTQMQQDIAIIKNTLSTMNDRMNKMDDRIAWIEEFLIKTSDF
jgi:hypothetical protein